MDEYFSNIKEEFTIFQDYKAVGDIYRLKGDLEKAQESYDKMILKNGDKFEYLKELADEYEKMAKAKINDSKALKAKAKEENAKLQTAYQKRSEAYKLYNQYKEEGNAAEANAQAEIMKAQKALMDEAEANAKALLAQADEVKKEAEPFYVPEQFYRGKYIDYLDGESYNAFYKHALALYNAGPDYFEEAEERFKQSSGLAPDRVNPYNYRLQIARYNEEKDPETTEWLMAVPAQDFVDVFGEKGASELNKGSKRFLVACYGILVSKAFNPKALDAPTEADIDCEAARPIAEKLIGLDPNNATAKGILDFCK